MSVSDWIKAYEHKLPHWAESRIPSPLAAQLLQILDKKKGNNILEIGVGNGRDCIFFAKEGNVVTGIDVVSKAIDVAKTNAEAEGADHIQFLVENAEKLSFQDESFDAVYSVSVLHATNLNLSLKELSRVLKIGGKAMVYLYEKTISDGREFWFRKREDVEKLLKDFNLSIKDKWDVVHTGHENEKTTVLIYKLQKI
ncbi:MAG: class I SAM-dependent methyltransferase [Acidobacteriaceae bacterium]